MSWFGEWNGNFPCLPDQPAVSPPRVEGVGGLAVRSRRRAARLRVGHEVPTRSGGLALPPWGTVDSGFALSTVQARITTGAFNYR